MTKHKQIHLTNVTFHFLNHLRQREQTLLQTKTKNLERHHILPKHDGGKDQDEVIFCTPQDHTIAHLYRFLVYGQKGDWVAYHMRKNQTVVGRERSLLAVTQNKKKQNLFWNPIWQREQGKKGGKKDGNLNSPSQKKQRHMLGLTYGAQTGRKNQSMLLSQFLKHTSLWVYQSENLSFCLIVPPQKSFADGVRVLQSQPGQEKLKKIKPSILYKLIYDERKQIFKWQLFACKLF